VPQAKKDVPPAKKELPPAKKGAKKTTATPTGTADMQATEMVSLCLPFSRYVFFLPTSAVLYSRVSSTLKLSFSYIYRCILFSQFFLLHRVKSIWSITSLV
jgi:hypothetical protein